VALASDVNLLLVRVPAGDFTMGSTEADLQAESDEMPQHAVYLDEYQIGKYEVTVAQWRAFVEATGYPADSRALADPDDRPVRYVSWDDAVAFCEWASIVTGRSVRLPTEAQWEKAARGTDARIYPWGSNAPSCSLCNFRHGSNYCAGDTSAVGSSSPQGDSIYGCADMAGNVWEWARDSYASNYYGQPSAGTNPTGPASGDSHVLRGGSWNSGAGYVRAADRAKYAPDTRYDGLGFRVCVSPIQL
jgi:serine/threonine-protein kinase